MADILDQVMEFLKLHPEQAQEFFNKLKISAEAAGPAFAKAASGLKGIVTAAQEIAPEIIEQFQNIRKQVDGFVEALNLGQEETGNLLNASAAIFIAWKSQLKPDAFSAIGDSARGFNTNLVDIADNLGKITKVLPQFAGGPLEQVAKMGAQYAAISQPARDFESGLLAAASASGELGDILDEVGDDFSGLTDKTIKYTELTYEIAQASGRSATDVGKYAAELMKIPGALSSSIDLTKDGAEQMHLLDATMKIAAGTGQAFQSVFEDMNFVFREFGTTGNSSLEFIARLSEASKALKMPLDLVKDYVKGAAQSFRFLGDNSQGAINILGKFGSALKDSGLGPKAIADLTRGVTDGISKMSIAQNAFLSQTAGGVGGLQGAFQIDLLKKQGKVDEVQKMVEESLRKQFGGRIVTLEEGAKSQGAAAQLTKQVQLLTTGPTAIAGTKEEAFRILEAMAKGGAAKTEPAIKGPQESLQSAVEKGTSVQERQASALTMLSNLAEKEVMFAAISANNLNRLVTGKDSPLVKRFLAEEREVSTEKAANAKMITGSGPEAATPRGLEAAYKDQYENISRMGKNAKDSIDNGLQEVYTRYQMKQKETSPIVPKPTSRFENPEPFKLMEMEQMPLPSSRRQVAEMIGEPGQDKMATGATGTKGSNEALVTVAVTCQNCNTKIAEETSIRVVDSKIASVKKGDILQPFTGTHLG